MRIMVTVYSDLLNQALEARKRQDKNAALALYKKAIEFDPNQFQAYKEAAIICKDLKLLDEAIVFFDKALSLKPNDEVALIQRAICERNQGNCQNCLDQLLALVEKKSTNWLVSFEIALTYKELNQLENAQAWLQNTLDIVPSNLNALLELAYLARLQCNSELAARWFLTAIKYHPTNIKSYLEVTTELQALGKDGDITKTLKLGVINSKNPIIFQKYLLSSFAENPFIAAQELLLHASYYEISMAINRQFLSYLISGKTVLNLTELPTELVGNLFKNRDFVVRVMSFKIDPSGIFKRLLDYFEPLLEIFTEKQHQGLVGKDLFVLLILFAALKENEKLKQYVIEPIDDYAEKLTFDDICLSVKALRSLLTDKGVFTLFAKCAKERHSVDALLFCLIIVDYYPKNPALADFSDEDFLLKLLPNFGDKDPGLLKNILVHLLQKELLTMAQLETMNFDATVIDAVKSVCTLLKPVFQSNRLSFVKPEKLKVALCISGQLRGYKEAYASLKEVLIDPLQPDIYVHTWRDVGFKEPFMSSHADRVFSGYFLAAYKNLFHIKNYSYSEIKALMPSVFSLLDNSATIDKAQLQAFYKTDFVEIEDDASLPFSEFPNRDKMFYKIHACDQLVAKSGKHYDLVIRVRPDVVFSLDSDVNWLDIAEICNTSKVILANAAGVGFGGFNENGGGGYTTGDSFAISSQIGISYYANVGISKNIFNEQGLGYFSVVSSHVTLGHGLWLGGYKRQDIPFAKKARLVNISLKAEDIYKVIQQDLPNMDKTLADEFIQALELDMAGVPYKDPYQVEKKPDSKEIQALEFCSPFTKETLKQHLLAQFDQDSVVASYDLMLYSRYYEIDPELVVRYFSSIINDSPVTLLKGNESLAYYLVTSDVFVTVFMQNKNSDAFDKVLAFFSDFILTAATDEQPKNKNLQMLAEVLE